MVKKLSKGAMEIITRIAIMNDSEVISFRDYCKKVVEKGGY